MECVMMHLDVPSVFVTRAIPGRGVKQVCHKGYNWQRCENRFVIRAVLRVVIYMAESRKRPKKSRENKEKIPESRKKYLGGNRKMPLSSGNRKSQKTCGNRKILIKKNVVENRKKAFSSAESWKRTPYYPPSILDRVEQVCHQGKFQPRYFVTPYQTGAKSFEPP